MMLVGGKRFRTQTLLSAMDAFYDSAEAKALVDQVLSLSQSAL